LELGDWDLKEALRSMKEDREWQKDDMSPDDLKAGQIGIKVDFKNGSPKLRLKGVGKSTDHSPEQTESRQKVKVHRMAPAIESKSVLPEDLCNAAPQHGTVGVELKTLSRHS